MSFKIEPLLTASDISLCINEKAAASVNSCRIKSFRSGGLTGGERDDNASSVVLGVVGYKIEISKMIFKDDAVDIHSLHDFSVTLNVPDKKIEYCGCEWLEIEENYSQKEYLIEKAVLLCKGRVCAEAEK